MPFLALGGEPLSPHHHSQLLLLQVQIFGVSPLLGVAVLVPGAEPPPRVTAASQAAVRRLRVL